MFEEEIAARRRQIFQANDTAAIEEMKEILEEYKRKRN